MSLLYIIDAYNVINHPSFKTEKKLSSIQRSLLNFIQKHKLTGSKKNKIILVFDGYPPQEDVFFQDAQVQFIFSRLISADQKIEMLISESADRKNIVVVTDDRQVQFMARSLHAQVCPVSGFSAKSNKRVNSVFPDDSAEDKVSFVNIQKINAELKEKWLK
jgi:predicted RNA-binding protein with PIN domain